jgi:hypothetical protein
MFLSWTLTLSLLSPALQANAASTSPDIVAGENYPVPCEGLLDAIQTEDVERFLLGQIQSPQQALKLLADYGLIYSGDFQRAVMITLEDRGVKAPPYYGASADAKTGKPPELPAEFVRGVVGVAKLPEPQFKIFVEQVLSNYEKIVNATDVAGSRSQIRSLVAHRFIKALREVESQFVLPTYNLFLRTVVLDTARDLLHDLTRKQGQWDPALTSLMGPTMGGLCGLLVGSLTNVACLTFSSIDIDTTYSNELRVFLGSGIAGFLFGFAPLIFFSGRDEFNKAQARSLVPQQSFQVTMDDGRTGTTMSLFLEDYEKNLTDLVVSLNDVCRASSVCQFTPVQLAYLGHIDLLEIEAKAANLQFLLGSIGVGEKFSEIRKAANDLRQHPGDYLKQMAFRHMVMTTTSNTMRVESAIRENLRELATLIEAKRKQLEQIRQRLYNFPLQQYSPDLLRKNQIIAVKLDADLETITSVSTNQDQILSRFEKLKPMMERLNALVLNSVHPPEVWQQAASEILVVLDHAETGGRP